MKARYVPHEDDDSLDGHYLGHYTNSDSIKSSYKINSNDYSDVMQALQLELARLQQSYAKYK